MGTKKTEWLYCSADCNVLACRRKTIKDTVRARNRCVSTWTPTGRLVCGDQLPPSRAVPQAVATSPLHLRLRTPMTRAEVTEQNLIEAASRGPPPTLNDLSLLSEEEKERVTREREAALLALARERNSSSSSSYTSSSSSYCGVVDGPAFAIGARSAR